MIRPPGIREVTKVAIHITGYRFGATAHTAASKFVVHEAVLHLTSRDRIRVLSDRI
jgi:hypothetical protein